MACGVLQHAFILKAWKTQLVEQEHVSMSTQRTRFPFEQKVNRMLPVGISGSAC